MQQRRWLVAVALVAVAALLQVQVSEAQEHVGINREDILSVLAPVHAHPEVHIRGSEHTPKGRNCRREFTRDIQPVCASNGKKYINDSVFVYEQCLLRAQEDALLEKVDMDFCKEAEMEDTGLDY